MQLVAINHQGKRIAINYAEKGVNYLCPECGGTIRKKEGVLRQSHFFHIDDADSCSFRAKTEEHINTQLAITNFFEEGEAILEKRFDSINRIADVVVEKERLVFEVQVSPISLKELQSRNKDYGSLGYRVIWILHTKTFGRDVRGDIERYLLSSPHYYTDIDREGVGSIFDKDAKPDLSKPQFLPKLLSLPEGLPEKRSDWPMHFKGDHIDHLVQGNYVAKRNWLQKTVHKMRYFHDLWLKIALCRVSSRGVENAD